VDPNKQLDNHTPGGVYLCQVKENVSCGACCGLYNVADVSRNALESLLIQRTVLFADIPRDMDSILAFKTAVEARENQQRPYPEFHHCPFIGFIDSRYSRVGCLLHPLNLKNNGIDFRGISYYGGMACRSYFCPTHYQVPRVYKEIVREVVDDWYLYGLIITEDRLLNAFFSLIAQKMGHPLKKADILTHHRRVAAVQEFLQLKLNWPFQSQTVPKANYFFKDKLYSKPHLNENETVANTSLFAPIFYELCSCFSSHNELIAAENILENIIFNIVGSDF
jgi:hypothetical protein